MVICGKEISTEEIEQIKKMIAENQQISRRQLSQQVSERFNWRSPKGVEGLKWILLTTCEVRRFEQAIEKLQWYCLRLGIEIYHRTLKSGCKIEQRQLGSAERIETCLAIDMVVAWRIYHLTKLGRETPDVACTVFFEDTEWKALVAYKTQNPIPPEKPPTL